LLAIRCKDNAFTNLDVANRKYSHCAMSFTLEPIPVDLPEKVDGVAFLERQFPVK